MIWNRGEFTQIQVEKDWQELGRFLLDRFLNEEAFVKNTYARQHAAGKELELFSRKVREANLSRTPLEGLVDLYSQLQEGWLVYDQTNVLPWFVGGDFLYEHVREQLKTRFPELNEKEFLLLASPTQKSFSAEEELKLLKLALEAKTACARGFQYWLDATAGGNDESGEKLDLLPQKILAGLDELVREYYWIPFGYDGPAVYDRKYYAKALSEVVAKNDVETLKEKIGELEGYEKTIAGKQATVIGKFGVPLELEKQFENLRLLTVMTDERKQFSFQAHVALDKLFKEITSRLGIEPVVLKYVTLYELKQNLENARKLRELWKRRAESIFITGVEECVFRIIEGAEAERMAKEMLPKTEKTNFVKGAVGSKGANPIIIGTARILFSPEEIGRMNEGEVLVTQMTTPEFVPAMRKAVAVVTDEGGVTCHAAIVSRELGIPCVIGTKTATKVFKDGDLLEVDASKGTVKLVS